MPRRVLVVDDEPLVLDVTATMLEDFGCEVVTAGGGQEALKKLSADRKIEILITDINMPGMDGCELAAAAVRMREQLKVIVLSGRPQGWLRISSRPKALPCRRSETHDETKHRPVLNSKLN